MRATWPSARPDPDARGAGPRAFPARGWCRTPRRKVMFRVVSADRECLRGGPRASSAHPGSVRPRPGQWGRRHLAGHGPGQAGRGGPDHGQDPSGPRRRVRIRGTSRSVSASCSNAERHSRGARQRLDQLAPAAARRHSPGRPGHPGRQGSGRLGDRDGPGDPSGGDRPSAGSDPLAEQAPRSLGRRRPCSASTGPARARSRARSRPSDRCSSPGPGPATWRQPARPASPPNGPVRA